MGDYLLVENCLIMGEQSKQYVMRLRDMPSAERPREKLIESGPESLSVAELLAVILNVGTKKEEELMMSERILKEYGEKTIVSQRDPKALQKELDIPLGKACQIVAAFEIGKRYFDKKPGRSVSIRNAKQAFNFLKEMQHSPKEHLKGLYLNSHYQIIHEEVISVGSLTSNIIHPREVYKPAIQYSAAAIIIAHNHPSGDIKPTKSDIEATIKIKKAGDILGIDLLDHLIIGKSKYLSLIEGGFCE